MVRLVSKREDEKVLELVSDVILQNRLMQSTLDAALEENVRLKRDLLASFRATRDIAAAFRCYQDDPDMGVLPEDLEEVVCEFRDRIAEIEEHNVV